MAKSIEINILNSSGTYETLYPKTLGSLVDGAVGLATSATSANTANTLTTSRTIRTNLSSTSLASFNGSANITPGVTGILGVSNGGTGVTSYASLASYLSSYISASLPSKTCALDIISWVGDGASDRYINYSTPSGCKLFAAEMGMNTIGSGSSDDSIQYIGRILIRSEYQKYNAFFKFSQIRTTSTMKNYVDIDYDNYFRIRNVNLNTSGAGFTALLFFTAT